ncbi:MAG: ABC transporter permease [Gemmatimonadaceae bacterium]
MDPRNTQSALDHPIEVFAVLTTLLQDIKYAVRTLLKARGFTAAAVLTLALGMGATTAIFSVVNGVLLRPLPYPNADRLTLLWLTLPQAPAPELPFSAATFIDLRARTQAFEHLAAFRSWPFTMSANGESEVIGGTRVTPALFDALGERPLHGRALVAADDDPGAEKVVVLSNALWRRRFGADRAVLGTTLTLNGDRYTIVGVMPAGFTFPRGAELPRGLDFPVRTELWTAMALSPQQAAQRWTLNLAVIGTRKRGLTADAAQADVASAMRAIATDLRAPPPRVAGVRTMPLREQSIARVRPALLVLMVAVALVLLIACANVANLLLTRTIARQRELAIRSALGAGRGRLVRQLLAENVLMALVASGLGVLLAMWGKDAILALVPSSLPRSDDVTIDATVIALAVALALVAGCAFGLVAALYASRAQLIGSLKDGGRGSAGVIRRNFRQALVAAEVAISLVLLVGATLLIRTFVALERVDPGFRPDHALAADIVLPTPPGVSLATPHPEWNAFFTEYADRLSRQPGVVAVGASTALPLTGAWDGEGFQPASHPVPADKQRPSALTAAVSPDFFRASGMRLLRGRGFTSHDDASAPPVMIVSETMARTFWPGEDALGQRVEFAPQSPSIEIVGIVADVHTASLGEPAGASMFFAFAQRPLPFASVVVRTAGDPRAVTDMLRRELTQLHPATALSGVRTLDDIFAHSLAEQRFSMILLGGFAAAALALAVIGLYGVIAFGVAQRTREIGVRVALGARPRDVLALLMAQGARAAASGIVIGIGVALVASRALTRMLFGIGAADPLTYIGVSALLLAVAMLASYVPARRATRVEPVAALRQD